MSEENDEYELIPMSPIKQLKKRIDKLESSPNRNGGKTIEDLVQVVKINQQVVDDIVKINSEIVNKVTQLSSSVDGLTNKLNDFMNRIEIAGEGSSDSGDEIEEKLNEKVKKLEKKINSLILSRTPSKEWRKLERRAKKRS